MIVITRPFVKMARTRINGFKGGSTPKPNHPPSYDLKEPSRPDCVPGVQVVEFTGASRFKVIQSDSVLWTQGMEGLDIREKDFVKVYPPANVTPEIVAMVIESLESLGAVVRKMPTPKGRIAFDNTPLKVYGLREAVTSLVSEGNSQNKEALAKLVCEVMDTVKVLVKPV